MTAINNAGVSLASQLGLLTELLAEHKPPAARKQLKLLWEKWIGSTYKDGLVAAPVQRGASAAPAARLSTGQVATPLRLDSPRD